MYEYAPSGFRWCPRQLCWLCLTKDGQEVAGTPPFPKWVKRGQVNTEIFVEIWHHSTTLNEVKKTLFWFSLDGLMTQANRISNWLETIGYEPLPDRTLVEVEWMNEATIERLEESGILRRAPKDYDAVKALLAASTSSEIVVPQQIQTIEVGMRFTAKK